MGNCIFYYIYDSSTCNNCRGNPSSDRYDPAKGGSVPGSFCPYDLLGTNARVKKESHERLEDARRWQAYRDILRR